jgi:hypothetical protein
MLKRHLKTAYNMTPEEYRDRWGLPTDYPMVAPNYARQRSSLAKQIGLGTRARRGPRCLRAGGSHWADRRYDGAAARACSLPLLLSASFFYPHRLPGDAESQGAASPKWTIPEGRRRFRLTARDDVG